jgi:hypothetical protein
VLIALLFAVLVLWRYTDAARGAYSAPLGTGIGDLGFLVGAGSLVASDDADLLYQDANLREDDEGSAEIARRMQEWFENDGAGGVYPVFYPYAPAAAFATAPVAQFESGTVVTLWRVGVALASGVLALCVARAFCNPAWRVAIFLAIVVWQPLLQNARIGQTGAFIAALLAVGLLLHLRDRKIGAIALAFLAPKPTALVAPILIVFQERPAIWLRFGATVAVLVLLPFLYLGPESFVGWLRILEWRAITDAGGGHAYNQGLSSAIGSSSVLGLGLIVMLGLIGLVVVRAVQAKMGLHVAMAFAVFCGCLVNPHSLFYDWGTAFTGIMLLRMSDLAEEPMADLVFGLLAISLFVAGQYTWDVRHEAGQFLRPLTLWTLLVTGALFLETARRYAVSLRSTEFSVAKAG